MMRLFGILLFTVLHLTTVTAAPCESPRANGEKPVLSGHVQDDSQGLGFLWRSLANKRRSWEVENGICNSGSKNLIISWPKTSLFTTAFRPLPPGRNILNSYSVLAEPQPGSSEITYGYQGTSTSAEHYEAKTATTSLPPLFSRIEAVLSSDSTSQQAKETVVAYYFEAVAKGDGYEFEFYTKTSDSRFFWLGISSSQNKLFAAALAEQKRQFNIASLNEFSKTSATISKLNVGESGFVFIRPSGNYERVILPIPVQPRKVELAHVILLDSELNPIAAGKVALFGQ